MDSCAITSSRPAWLITGNFGPKFSPNAFADLLTHSNHRWINARWALFSRRIEAKRKSLASETTVAGAKAFGVRTVRHCARVCASLSRHFAQRYLHGPGTGITNFPSFSATKFSLVLDELPLPSFFSTLMTSFFVGLRVRQTLPVGPSRGVVAFLTSSGVRFTS